MSSLADYLKKYTSDGNDLEKNTKKLKKKKRKKDSVPSLKLSGHGVRIIDDDVPWQKEIKEDEEDEDDPEAELFRSLGLSPPRKSRTEPSPSKDVSPDLSPPRKARTEPKHDRHDSPDLSPPRRRASPDLSPPRKPRTEPDPHRHDSPDLSPPRRRSSPNLSPPRKPRTEPNPRRHDSPDLSPPRRRTSPDLSPPRKSRTEPDRRIHESHDLSPPRRGRRQETGEDMSPPRKPRHDSRGGEDGRRAKGQGPVRMSDGTVAGLRTGKEVTAEMDVKRKQDSDRFRAMDTSVTGRGAQTVYRDKQGKKTNLEAIMEQGRVEAESKKKKLLPPAIWSKGLAQTRQAMEEAKILEEASSQPFARYSQDESLDKQLKEAIRWGDPMAHLVKPKQQEVEFVDYSANPLFQASGFKIPQEVPAHSWIKRRVSAPPNRYGIKPGRHWDGVDRGTGFEKELFKAKNERMEKERQAYMWSVEDM